MNEKTDWFDGKETSSPACSRLPVQLASSEVVESFCLFVALKSQRCGAHYRTHNALGPPSGPAITVW